MRTATEFPLIGFPKVGIFVVIYYANGISSKHLELLKFLVIYKPNETVSNQFARFYSPSSCHLVAADSFQATSVDTYGAADGVLVAAIYYPLQKEFLVTDLLITFNLHRRVITVGNLN